MQLCWTVLPQGFKNSPTIFGNILTKELEQWHREYEIISVLQYVDDILIGSDTQEERLEAIVSLRSFLGLAGYSLKKKRARLERRKSTIWALRL